MTTRIKALALAAALGGAVIVPTLAVAHGDGPKDGRRAAHMEMRFQAMDANKDGKLSAEEIEAFGAARFAKADANGDGKLSVEEMDNARAEQRKERFGRMIAKLDKDGDGQLSAAEMPKRGERMMKLDTDGDGAISLDEMKAAKGHHGPKN
ncbi:MAG: EF-hand domain-containing protein [Thalassobaculaceae bacterium]|nr:EF-hand domain-containing protein [Thalassobaculaceae bacterium]